MIPQSIERKHVLLAITDIRTGGVPKKREPTKFNLVHDGRLYPPKFALSLAAKYATGEELPAVVFSGGDEANSYLTALGFEIQPKRDDWSWKECYFAVWGYDQLDLDPTQVKAALYREISELIGRTAKSVEFKLQNVSSFDPRPREQKPIAEAKNAQALLGEVFRWYWADRSRARALYNQFREEFQFNLESTTKTEPIKGEAGLHVIIEEGASNTAPATRRKRSQKLLEEGRKHFRGVDREGKLRCRACGFVTPDGLDAEVIHLHHTEPIYESGEEGRSIKLKDALALLVPLFPTCHALAHTSRPPLSVAAIQALKP
jgi:predicted HNH restriction endonuclease